VGDWADDCEREADFREEEALEFLKEVNEAQAAVIEAAKAWLHERIHDRNGVRNVACQYTKGALGLTGALEALQEVEGE